MHPMVIRSDGAFAPNTDDGTMVGRPIAAPAVTADALKKPRRLIPLLTELVAPTHGVTPHCCIVL